MESTVRTKIVVFIEHLKSVRATLKDFTHKMGERENKLNLLIDDVEVKFKNTDAEGIKSSSQLTDLININAEYFRSCLANWSNTIRLEVKNREFINHFDDSVIVLVYGKVNCGKSTLGNFLSGRGFHDISNTPYASVDVDMFSYDDGNRQQLEKLAGRSFGENVTECTSTIQGATIEGLTWVDTPGLHASAKNQELAKTYADHADLILYLVSSDSPLRQGDREELETLRSQDKPVLIVVSKFDDPIRGVDPKTKKRITKGFNPKPKENREQQQEWIESELQKYRITDILKNRDYCFVSAKVAKTAVKNSDIEMFDESGMSSLYEQLTKVLSSDSVVDLKTANPQKRFNTLIRDIIGTENMLESDFSIASVKHVFDNLLTELQEHREKLYAITEETVQQIRVACAAGIESILRDEGMKVERGELPNSQIGEKVRSIIEKNTLDVISREIIKIFLDVELNITRNLSEVARFSIPSIEQKYQNITVTNEIVAKGTGQAIGSAGGGLAGAIYGAEIGATLGTAIPLIGNIAGGLLGGVIGGFLGSTAGGAVGKAVGSSVVSTKNIEVAVGSNVEEIIESLFGELEKKLPSQVDEILNKFAEEYFVPIEDLVNEITMDLDDLKQNLCDLKYN